MPRTVDCEICGAPFECKGPLAFGCWCSEALVSDERRAELKLLADDCVCPNCLNQSEKN